MNSPKSARLGVRIVAYGLMVLFAFTLIELFVIAGLKAPGMLNNFPVALHEAFRRFYIRRDMYSPTLSPDCGRYDSGTFYTLKPGECLFKNREFAVKLRVNSAGLRDDENSLSRPNIIVLGDSEAMGWALDEPLTFASTLERETGLTVLNASMGSFGTARESIMLERLDRSALKAVILQYNANDYTENATFAADGKITIRSENEYEEWRQSNEKRRRYIPFRFTYYFIKDNVRRFKNLPTTSLSMEKELDAFLPPFRELAGHVPGIPIFLFEMGGGNMNRKGFAEGAHSRLKTLDPDLAARVIPVQLADGFDKSMIFDLDWHFNAKGHAVVADRLKAALSAQGVVGR
ncbi:MAG: hypothetical protein RIA64_01670 [Rhodospirillales bacterium]